MNKKDLYIFTISFPLSNLENFLYNEVKVLSGHYQRIFLFPMTEHDKECVYELPENISIVKFNIFQPYNRLKIILNNPGIILSVFIKEIFNGNSGLNYLMDIGKNINDLTHKLAIAERLSVFCSENKHNIEVAYTYWFNQWTFILALMKLKGNIFNLYTRIHGSDVYEDQHEKGFYFKFRTFQLKMINKVLAISENGKLHLQSVNKINEKKITVSRLGVLDNGLNPVSENDMYRIVTCSAIQKYKRLNLMVDILKNTKSKIEWVHFGDGELKEQLLTHAQSLKNNCVFRFMGAKGNDEVIEYYKNNCIDLFMNVSESEGIPVSIMEAISFGIPVIAPNIGGVSEIVNQETGVLIPKYFEPDKVAKLIESLIKEPYSIRSGKRKTARAFWEMNYSAEKNYNNLALELK